MPESEVSAPLFWQCSHWVPLKTNDLAVRPLISARESEKMIWHFIRHGNHSRRDAMKSAPKNSIEGWFAENNEPLRKLVIRCRSYERTVPFVENLASSSWYTLSESGGVSASIIKSGKDQPEIEVLGPGIISVDYEKKFESACQAKTKAIEEASLDELHTSIIKGIASIESYIAHRTEIWNRQNITQAPLNDNKNAKVPFDDKIRIWIPIMANGQKLNLGGKMWADFQNLREIRDNDAIHPKSFAQGISFSDLAAKINLFRTGIADFLLQLHILFDEAVPRIIIRARHFPEVYART